MSWTKINKPSSSSYTKVNPSGRVNFDQADIKYDSAVVFYDGFDPNAWTKVNKPTTENWTKINKPT